MVIIINSDIINFPVNPISSIHPFREASRNCRQINPIANAEDLQLVMKTLKMSIDSPSIHNAAVSAATRLEHSPSDIDSDWIAL